MNPLIPEIDPNQIVNYIVSRKEFKVNGQLDVCRVKLEKPMPARELSCPDCGSKKGFYNAPWDAWSCKEDACLDWWLPRHGRHLA